MPLPSRLTTCIHAKPALTIHTHSLELTSETTFKYNMNTSQKQDNMEAVAQTTSSNTIGSAEGKPQYSGYTRTVESRWPEGVVRDETVQLSEQEVREQLRNAHQQFKFGDIHRALDQQFEGFRKALEYNKQNSDSSRLIEQGSNKDQPKKAA
ncbi:hypothetical protein GQ42DRAFT_19010 [Ramicandelaber brevisporus]|nr:hypothetical protein GQ42DRAFT_19010 [Ramicandelaber brevisporus]